MVTIVTVQLIFILKNQTGLEAVQRTEFLDLLCYSLLEKIFIVSLNFLLCFFPKILGREEVGFFFWGGGGGEGHSCLSFSRRKS